MELQAQAALNAAAHGTRAQLKLRVVGGKQVVSKQKRQAMALHGQRMSKDEEEAIAMKDKWLLSLSPKDILKGLKLGTTLRQARDGLKKLENLGLSSDHEILDNHLMVCTACTVMAVDNLQRLTMEEWKTFGKTVMAAGIEIPGEACLAYVKRFLINLRKLGMDQDTARSRARGRGACGIP